MDFSYLGVANMHEPLPKLNPHQWVSEHGETLYAYAMSRLKNADSAEETVQEALLGALNSAQNLPSVRDVGPWLMGILKHKVVDRQRRNARSESSTSDVTPLMEQLFDESGHWSKSAKAADPLRLDLLEQAEFMGVFRRCLQDLPTKQAKVFVGRELDERSSEDLCKEFGVTSTNLWVLMHRARLRLAECIRARWAMGDL